MKKIFVFLFMLIGFSALQVSLVLAATGAPLSDLPQGVIALLKIPGVTDGANQGPIKELAGSSLVFGFGENVQAVYDIGTGLPTGRPVVQPPKILKAFDGATPTLHQALLQNTPLQEVYVLFYKRDVTTGAFINYFSVIVNGAKITGITTSQSGETGGAIQEVISITGQKITWRDEVTGAEFAYDVQGPV